MRSVVWDGESTRKRSSGSGTPSRYRGTQPWLVRIEILRVYHNDLYGGHLGRDRTLELIARKYTWSTLRRDVEEYVRSCPECQRNTTPPRRPFGELAPLRCPGKPWQDLSMEFITGLPDCRHREVYDAILAICDRYSKSVKYTPTTKKVKADELADLFTEHVLNQQGAPSSLVSDRDSPFKRLR